nr:4'-phosphopantetheinyl transferase superfamily protein [Allorhizobium ampelinum]
MWRYLSADEKERARKYRYESHRDTFVMGRGLLRTLLSERLKVPEQEIRFVYGPFGKPHLLDYNNNERIHFNVSNAEDVVAIAMSSTTRVGIDVERKKNESYEEIYPFVLSDRELHEVRGADPQLRGAAFISCWTRKEALVKAAGLSISSLATIELSNEQNRIQLCAADWDGTKHLRKFSAWDESLIAGFSVSIACDSARATVKSHRHCFKT